MFGGYNSTVCRIGRRDSSTKGKQKDVDRPLVAGGSISHKSRPVHVSRRDFLLNCHRKDGFCHC